MAASDWSSIMTFPLYSRALWTTWNQITAQEEVHSRYPACTPSLCLSISVTLHPSPFLSLLISFVSSRSPPQHLLLALHPPLPPSPLSLLSPSLAVSLLSLCKPGKRVGEKGKCSNPLRSHKFNIFILPRLLKVLGSAFTESISHNIVKEVMVMHEDAGVRFIPEQVLSVR